MIIADASIVVAAIFDDEELGDRSRARLIDEDLAAPAHLDLEVMSVLRRKLHRGEVRDTARVHLALNVLSALPIERVAIVDAVHRCWSLRGNLTPYDAAYVALAEARQCALVTLDRRLADAPGPRCTIEVLE